MDSLIEMLTKLQEENDTYKTKLFSLTLQSKAMLSNKTRTSTVGQSVSTHNTPENDQMDDIIHTNLNHSKQSEHRDCLNVTGDDQSHQCTSFININTCSNSVRIEELRAKEGQFINSTKPIFLMDKLPQEHDGNKTQEHQIDYPTDCTRTTDIHTKMILNNPQTTIIPELSVCQYHGPQYSVSRYALDVLTRRIKQNHVIKYLSRHPLERRNTRLYDTISTVTSRTENQEFAESNIEYDKLQGWGPTGRKQPDSTCVVYI